MSLRNLLRYKQLLGVTTAGLAGLALYAAGQPLAANVILGLASAAVTVPMAATMARNVIKGELGIDLLAVVAVSTALLLGEFVTAIVIAFMMSGGQALEDYAQAHAKKELSNLMDRAPKIAHVWGEGSTRDVPVAEVRVGDELLIKPGETVPVDAQILEGSSSFDESALTGESLPVDKTVGAALLSGSINSTGAVRALALRTSHNSQYEQIIELVKGATSSRSPLVRLADRYSVPFTIISFAIAGVAWWLSRDPVHALEVLVVATPCPLLIATPVAIVSGMSRAAKNGIIVKSGAALERLARVRSIAFDKTGTLTKGVPEIDTISGHAGAREAEVLALAAALEASSSHILAAAIVEAAQARGLKLPHVSAIHEQPGEGIKAKLGAQVVLVGRAKFLAEAGIAIPLELTKAQTATYVARGGHFLGVITFADVVRPETAATLAALARLGIRKTLMLTGDHAAVAQRIAAEIGLTDVRAGLLPAGKVAALRALDAAAHPVAMVGDGVNDAPILAASDVGIALGAKGSTAASESADVVIMEDDLARVPLAISISRRAIRIALQSILVGIGLSIVLMLIASTGVIKPVYGAILQEIVDVIVILNALRARSGGRVAPAVHPEAPRARTA